LDDKDLIEAFLAGDERAFAELVARHRRHVYRVARGILRRHDQADEAAQEAFVKAYQNLSGFQGQSSFGTWLHRIARNAALDLLAREGTQARVAERAAAEPSYAPPEPVRAPRPVEQLIREERIAELRRAVDQLPDRQRVTLNLRVREGLKFSEIAEALGCPVGTAKANFHHAVKNLKRNLSAAAEELRESTG
jgi:RNA polymerase sigma-70 factor (ECF subfamily)